MRRWFDRTIAAQIDYAPAWSEMRWGLRPRWHGSVDAMLALGKAALATRRFDTDVPRKFVDVINDLEAEHELPFGTHLSGREDIWPDLLSMYQGYIAEPSQEQHRAAWRSALATAAYIAGKYEVARDQLKELNWQVDPASISGWGRDLSLMPLEVAARFSTVGEKIIAAEASYQSGAVAKSLEAYKAAQVQALDPQTDKWIRHRIATLGIEQRLAAGEWVDFLPASDDDPAWHVCSGGFRRTGSGIETGADRYGHLLYSHARVGVNFEMRGTFETDRSPAEAFQAGVVMGLPEVQTEDWFSFRMKHAPQQGDKASFARSWTGQQVLAPIRLAKQNTFTLRFENGSLHATVNGAVAHRGATLRQPARMNAGEFLVGLGAFNDANDTVRYKDVQIRRLPRVQEASR